MRRMAVALLAALLAPATAAAQADVKPLVVEGEITADDHQRYRPVPFDVPEGVERITVTLSYDRSNKTVIDLGLWDPQRFRGWSGGTRDRFTVSASDASPGYLPGALPAGRWQVMLGVPNARPNSRAAYKVTVHFDRTGVLDATAAIAVPPLTGKPGWYRGDLHLHDAHSDGSCASQSGKRVPCPLYRTVERAAAAGLDFIAVTDHNTVSHFGELRQLQPYFDKLLLIPGIEITTFGGHANIFGPRNWVDFRVGSDGVPDARTLQQAIADSGGILSINHPALPSGEACMGCGWTWPRTNWGQVAAIEAINGTITTGPLAGTGFWYARLNEGHRLTGIGSSDNHDPDAAPERSRIGRPMTVVHASALSTPAILEGIRQGNVFIDVEGTRTRLLAVEAREHTRAVPMGGWIASSRGLKVYAHVIDAAGATARLIVNGALQAKQLVSGTDVLLRFELQSRSCGWAAVNVTDSSGRLLLIGNPIYLRC